MKICKKYKKVFYRPAPTHSPKVDYKNFMVLAEDGINNRIR